jgi:hypothetical protein
MKTRILLSALAAILAMATLPGQAETVTVPAGTVVTVELMENVQSAFNTTGEVIYLRVTEETSVDGKVIIPEGAAVEAVVDMTAGTGMVGKSGSVNFHPVRIAAADGEWLPLDPTNFGGVGEGASAGTMFMIGLFAKGKPGFVQRGAIYRVTTRRDKEVEVVALRPPRAVAAAEVKFTGEVKPLKKVNMMRTKPGRDIEIQLNCPLEMESLVPTGAMDIKVVSFTDYVPEMPVRSNAVEFDSRKHLLRASFNWWSIIKYSQPGSTALTVQFELSDGRLAQADLTMESRWKTN